ncbi:MAG TPA: SDR family NAD(P)-dependent oxidoreductase [Actinocrinis sp.]|uniref:SDR family NAD(P)-dependent oxidoreductase n=1 Tax=Actinocrinis sp. TaxID=1920516 RepID=UPI002DDD0D71|nr:SDR family NAD(P)-dependent oxidoreductase [Actinocrinis sp.]HEV2345539.1 SDR family NAD(P)-dependent oxidoreductase [Actinocrinis sp.]
MNAEARTVLITGSTSGLGRELVLCLAADGWAVLAHGRDRKRLDDLCREAGPAVRPLVADLASLDEVVRLAAQAAAATDRLDVLVNNAAVGFGAPGHGRQTSVDGHELRMAVNYLAPVLLTRRLVPLLTASAPARVVNVGSVGQISFDPHDVAFERGYDGITAYRRSKLALSAFTFDLADELPARAVTVNCLHPASLMPTAMVLESRMAPMSELDEGVVATLRLITDPDLADVTGEYFDGLRPGRSRPEAYDPDFRSKLRAVTAGLLADYL